MLVAAGCAESF